MASEIKSYKEVEPILGKASKAWERLVGYIRFNYVMDELWTTGKSTGKLSAYRDELKFRCGGKTLVTMYVREGFFKVVIILGKDERGKYEEQQSTFSDAIRNIYDNTHTYHDGKWLGIDVYDPSLIDDIIRLLKIKRKPNRKAVDMDITADTGRCGNRCDLCLINIKNNENGKNDRFLFHEMDWRCYHHEGEQRTDYTNTTCPGCGGMCSKTIECLTDKGFDNCGMCDYRNCTAEGEHIYGYEPGKCNLGLTADEVTRCIIPYCGKERYDMVEK
ncbi:MAG: DUF3788 domain-containing protein [Eubacteriales bacterium]|jgi:hypothetical protein|nr:DUF3788 domain-containing protein [Eubacteriales bacterium]